jgi:cytochrome c biogenesis protein CcmG/thiol:disulfide interchange protein DsbE
MRSLKLTGQVVALAAVAGLLALLIWKLTHQTHAPKIGGPAPAFSASSIDGGSVSLASLRGKAVVLNFWASWCVPCKTEATKLEEQWQQYRDEGVVFVGVDYHDVTSDARTFLERHGVTYTTVRDGSGAIGDRYGLTGVPETYFVNRQGRLVGAHIFGPITDPKWLAVFRAGIRAALAS